MVTRSPCRTVLSPCSWLAIIVWLPGCATPVRPYVAGSHAEYFTAPALAALNEPAIERGKPRPILDGIGWVIGIPDKIILWDRRIANHNISPETEEALATYLACNELDTVKVRLNQYAPLEDWRRLRANSAVGIGWKYSLGTLSWLGETLFPGRVFGYDHFNPYTNTVHIFSDAPAVALHEAGHAKDFARRKYKGTYAAVYLLPGAPLWHEAVATRDVLEYYQGSGDWEGEAEAFDLLYPAYGTYVGDAGGLLIPNYGELFWAGSLVAGHIWGHYRADQVRAWGRAQRDLPSPLAPSTPPWGYEQEAAEAVPAELGTPSVELGAPPIVAEDAGETPAFPGGAGQPPFESSPAHAFPAILPPADAPQVAEPPAEPSGHRTWQP
ncbi:MAG: hypothetical protein AB7F89_10400 [Pirellulaceae bacterium]